MSPTKVVIPLFLGKTFFRKAHIRTDPKLNKIPPVALKRRKSRLNEFKHHLWRSQLTHKQVFSDTESSLNAFEWKCKLQHQRLCATTRNWSSPTIHRIWKQINGYSNAHWWTMMILLSPQSGIHDVYWKSCVAYQAVHRQIKWQNIFLVQWLHDGKKLFSDTLELFNFTFRWSK